MKGLEQLIVCGLGIGSVFTAVYLLCMSGLAARDKKTILMWQLFLCAACTAACGVLVIGEAL